MNRRRAMRGFTLIEVVVAFTILALAFSVAYEAFGLSLRRQQRAIDEHTALLIAESLLDRAGVESPLAASSHGRIDEHFEWSLTAEELKPPTGEEPYSVPGYELTATISWQRDRHHGDLTLRTFALQPER